MKEFLLKIEKIVNQLKELVAKATIVNYKKLRGKKEIKRNV